MAGPGRVEDGIAAWKQRLEAERSEHAHRLANTVESGVLTLARYIAACMRRTERDERRIARCKSTPVKLHVTVRPGTQRPRCGRRRARAQRNAPVFAMAIAPAPEER
jgi:hypothetical protein